MHLKYYRPHIKPAAIVCLVLILDQITKAVVFKCMALHHTIPVIEGFLNFTHIHNPGGAFGLMANQGQVVRSFFFIFVSFAAMALIVYFYFKTSQKYFFFRVSLALIFGGALGNLIDRIRLGKVVDFLDFYIGKWHWPAFNIADSAITIGIVIYIFYIFFNYSATDLRK